MTGATVLAASLTAAAVALALAGRAVALLPVSSPAVPPERHRRLGVPVIGASAVVAATVLQGTTLALAGIVGGAALGGLRIAAKVRRDRLAAERRMHTLDFCEALLGELQAGQPLLAALERSVPTWPAAEPVAAAARLGGDVPAALNRLSSLPGAGALRQLAAAWQLSAATGARLAFAVEQVLETARAQVAASLLVQAELASARATARLVAVLPVVVLVAAQGLGAGAWQFLLESPAGLICLAAGVALVLVGLGWIERIATAAAEGGP